MARSGQFQRNVLFLRILVHKRTQLKLTFLQFKRKIISEIYEYKNGIKQLHNSALEKLYLKSEKIVYKFISNTIQLLFFS